jgi:DNA-binding NtrC family response regulator
MSPTGSPANGTNPAECKVAMSPPHSGAAIQSLDVSRPTSQSIEAIAAENLSMQLPESNGPPGNEFETILGDLAVRGDTPDQSGLITVDELERRYIQRVLLLTAGNKSRAAQILGFDRRTLYRKIERYGRSS